MARSRSPPPPCASACQHTALPPSCAEARDFLEAARGGAPEEEAPEEEEDACAVLVEAIF